MKRSRLGAVALAVGVVAGAAALAAPAAAHVTVNPREATQGGFAQLEFRVPNERPDASTVEVEVHFPEETPIASVSVRPVPGWSYEVTRRTLDEPVEAGHGVTVTEVVESITWTAVDDESAIKPGEFGVFTVSVGPLPHAETLVFPALQTYSSGEVVRWIDPPVPGSEPPLPAPVLRLVAADGDGGGAGADDTGDDDTTAAASGSGGGDAGVWLGAAGLVAGLAGLVLGGLAFARTRRA